MESLHHPTDACSIVASVACGDVDIETIIKASLERSYLVQQELNPFTAIYDEDAQKQAKEASLRLKNGAAPRPLEGVPIAIKEFTPINGKSTTRGSAALKDAIGTDQPVLVQRLLDAGAIIVARTTTPEFAHSASPARLYLAIPKTRLIPVGLAAGHRVGRGGGDNRMCSARGRNRYGRVCSHSRGAFRLCWL